MCLLDQIKIYLLLPCAGIELVVEHFRALGHQDIRAFVPQWRNRGREAKVGASHLLHRHLSRVCLSPSTSHLRQAATCSSVTCHVFAFHLSRVRVSPVTWPRPCRGWSARATWCSHRASSWRAAPSPRRTRGGHGSSRPPPPPGTSWATRRRWAACSSPGTTTLPSCRSLGWGPMGGGHCVP